MDSVTHIVIGGIVGDVFLGRILGRKAMLYGAVFQSIPDIDFITHFWLDPVSELVSHRGITHSFLFAILITPLLAMLCHRMNYRYDITTWKWIFFIGAEILIHLFLDAFNAYGTGWLEPFSNARISFNSIFVLDPIFSIVPVIAFFVLLFTPRTFRYRHWWAKASLASVCIYLSISVFSKIWVYNDVREIARRHNISYDRHFTTPSPFNSILWFVVLESQKGYYTSYRSLFDTKDSMSFTYFPRNEHLLREVIDTGSVKKLKIFSDGYYTLESRGDTIVFNALRFGQQVGWYDPKAPFAFNYYLNYPDDNLLVVQRGRFARWNRQTAKSLLRRIAGSH